MGMSDNQVHLAIFQVSQSPEIRSTFAAVFDLFEICCCLHQEQNYQFKNLVNGRNFDMLVNGSLFLLCNFFGHCEMMGP